MKQMKEKMLESFYAVLPITVIVLVLSIILVPLETGTALLFLFGALLLVVGMGLFQLGADMAMMPLGEGISVEFSKTRNLLIMGFCSFLVGMLVTIAEPDLQVLARQVPSIPNMVMIMTVAVGVGIFLLIAVFKNCAKNLTFPFTFRILCDSICCGNFVCAGGISCSCL